VASSAQRSIRYLVLCIVALGVALVLSAPSPARAQASTAAPAQAGVCVTIDEAHDTFAAADRLAALLLLKRQFELAGQRVVEPGCQDAYAVSHVTFGTRIIITLSGPKGQRDATAMGMDDVPAVYSQMVRSLLRGEPMEAPGVVDRTNVSKTQAAARNRMHSDSVWYARLGYGAQFADQAYGGPSVGFLGYRREGNRFVIDVSFLNFQYTSSDQAPSYPYPGGSSGMTGTWLKLAILRYFSPSADRSPYIGGGLSLSTTHLDHGNTYWEGNGLQGELIGGYEMGRAGSIHIFVQGDAGLPFYKLRSTTYTFVNVPPYTYQSSVSRRYVPTLTVSLGLGWQRGGGQ
jgi:hypothetical protein